jgi:hypothetical protein
MSIEGFARSGTREDASLISIESRTRDQTDGFIDTVADQILKRATCSSDRIQNPNTVVVLLNTCRNRR